MPSQRPSTRAKKRLVRILGGLAALLVVGLLVNAWLLAQDDPTVNLSEPALPSPNAYDSYAAAIQSSGNSKLLSTAKMDIPFVGSRTAEQEEVLVKMEAELKRNAFAFQMLHEGFGHAYRMPPTRALMLPVNQFAGYRNLTRLSFAQSRVRAARGDWGGATDSALDAVQLGEEIQHGGGLIAHLTGCACEAIGQRPLWETIDHLNAAQSRAAAQRLQNIIDRHFAYADTLQEQKRQGQATLKLIFRGVTVRNAFSVTDTLLPDHPSPSERYHNALTLLYGKRRMMRQYTEYMDHLSQLARQSYGLHLPIPPVPTDPLINMMLDVYKDARRHDVETGMQNGFLLVTLALHAFQLEQGRYPAALTELVPGYLKQLPNDPFAVQGTFQYRVQGQRYVLYSIGPDGKDDGGIPFNDPKYVGAIGAKQRYHITSGIHGDVVAGINFP